jgi:hypothetical protein
MNFVVILSFELFREQRLRLIYQEAIQEVPEGLFPFRTSNDDGPSTGAIDFYAHHSAGRELARDSSEKFQTRAKLAGCGNCGHPVFALCRRLRDHLATTHDSFDSAHKGRGLDNLSRLLRFGQGLGEMVGFVALHSCGRQTEPVRYGSLRFVIY